MLHLELEAKLERNRKRQYSLKKLRRSLLSREVEVVHQRKFLSL